MKGRTVGHYRIERKLGEGGMGSVWLARDLTLDRPVAIKVIASRLAADPGARERFLREAKAASALDHSGIVTVYEAWSEHGELFIAFQYIDGQTLADRNGQGPVMPSKAIKIAAQVAEALTYAHEHGLVHRDVTARNIMTMKDGRVKLLDFGLSLPAGDTRVSLSATPMGTVGYMAPEVISGDEAGTPADIYGLGVVLFEMLTGQLPFWGERPEAVLYLALHGSAPKPGALISDISPSVDDLVARMMNRDPEKRPIAAQTLALLRGVGGPERESAANSRPWRAKKLGIMATAVPLVLLIVWVFGHERLHLPWPGQRAALSSLAVLPFQDESQDPEASAYLSLGLGEALTTRLAQSMDGVTVIPWMTSRRYMPPFDLSLPEIADELHVDGLIVGTFRKDDNSMKANVSLVGGKKGGILWVEEFQELGSDMQAMEGRVAVSLSDAIGRKPSGSQKELLLHPSSKNPEAYDLYLRGSNTLVKGSEEDMDQALKLFEEAVALDPLFPEAHVGIGAVHLTRFYYGWEGGDRNLDEARVHFTQALQEKAGDLSAIRGLIRVAGQRGDMEEVLRLGASVTQNTSNSVDYLLARADGFFFSQLSDLALPYLREVLRRDPNNLGAWYTFLVNLVWDGRFEEALRMGDGYHRLFGNDPDVDVWLGAASYLEGDLVNARLIWDEVLNESRSAPDNYIHIFAGILYRDLGDRKRAEEIWREGFQIFQKRDATYETNSRVLQTLLTLSCLLGETKTYETIAKSIHAGRFEIAFGECYNINEIASLLIINLDAGTFYRIYETMGKLFGIREFKTAPELSRYRVRAHSFEQALRSKYGDLRDVPSEVLGDTTIAPYSAEGD